MEDKKIKTVAEDLKEEVQAEETRKGNAYQYLYDAMRGENFYRWGKFVLAKPFSVGEREIKEIPFDYGKITGQDYMLAMAEDKGGKSYGFPSPRQLLALFAKAMDLPGVDVHDLYRELGGEDAMLVIQLGEQYYSGANFRAAQRLELGARS